MFVSPMKFSFLVCESDIRVSRPHKMRLIGFFLGYNFLETIIENGYNIILNFLQNLPVNLELWEKVEPLVAGDYREGIKSLDA